MFLVSQVKFSDGKSDVQILMTRNADKAHHAHQKSEAAFWAGFKSVVGGSYQAHETLEAALIYSAKIA